MVCSGRLLGPETLAVERLYRAAGLEVAGAELPDHVSLELAFLAYLVEQEAPSGRLERSFIRRHAGRWMPELGLRLARSRDEAFGPVGDLLAGWINERLRPVMHPKKTRSALPVISQSQDCTLCGFCVQACPRHALKIFETGHETALTLLEEACTGCGKCERACDFGAIRLLPCTRGQGEGQRLLYSSPRLACPVCGTATVSRAEFEFVAARIGRPDWLEICPGCRGLSLEIET
jgi:NAD-dependent dihydropyrimidine dehydrogenase PreA subunit